jgi:outer membrane protein assembly factor BamB
MFGYFRLKAVVAALGAIALSVAVPCGTARADENLWPQFRGPQFNPVVENPRLPSTWSADQNIEWSQPVPGRGWSSPIVVGNRVFLTTAITEGNSKSPQTGTDFSNEYVAELTKQGLSQEEIIKKVTERDIELPSEVTLSYRLICLDLNTGKEQWQTEIFHGSPPLGRHRKNSFTSETPVTDGERIYVYINGLGLFAYDLQGKPAWKRDLEALPIYLDFGTGSSPVLCENQLIIVNDNEKESFIS